ncbi:hypothetical protein N311_07214, partial [Apaloderma vittatum]
QSLTVAQWSALLLCSSKVILPSSWLSSSTLLTGSWKKFISAAKAAMAEGSWPNCARSIMSIFSRRRLSLLASRSRMSRACRFSGVSFARFSRMASRSLCSRRARCSSVSCMRCRRFASRWSSEWIRRCRPRDPGELRALPHTGHM